MGGSEKRSRDIKNMYHIILKSKAERQFKKLPKRMKTTMARAIDSLSLDPYVGKKLQGKLTGFWSLRIWPYRIIYSIEKKIVTVTIVTIRQRKDVY